MNGDGERATPHEQHSRESRDANTGLPHSNALQDHQTPLGSTSAPATAPGTLSTLKRKASEELQADEIKKATSADVGGLVSETRIQDMEPKGENEEKETDNPPLPLLRNHSSKVHGSTTSNPFIIHDTSPSSEYDPTLEEESAYSICNGPLPKTPSDTGLDEDSPVPDFPLRLPVPATEEKLRSAKKVKLVTKRFWVVKHEDWVEKVEDGEGEDGAARENMGDAGGGLGAGGSVQDDEDIDWDDVEDAEDAERDEFLDFENNEDNDDENDNASSSSGVSVIFNQPQRLRLEISEWIFISKVRACRVGIRLTRYLKHCDEGCEWLYSEDDSIEWNPKEIGDGWWVKGEGRGKKYDEDREQGLVHHHRLSLTHELRTVLEDFSDPENPTYTTVTPFSKFPRNVDRNARIIHDPYQPIACPVYRSVVPTKFFHQRLIEDPEYPGKIVKAVRVKGRIIADPLKPGKFLELKEPEKPIFINPEVLEGKERPEWKYLMASDNTRLVENPAYSDGSRQKMMWRGKYLQIEEWDAVDGAREGEGEDWEGWSSDEEEKLKARDGYFPWKDEENEVWERRVLERRRAEGGATPEAGAAGGSGEEERGEGMEGLENGDGNGNDSGSDSGANLE